MPKIHQKHSNAKNPSDYSKFQLEKLTKSSSSFDKKEKKTQIDRITIPNGISNVAINASIDRGQ